MLDIIASIGWGYSALTENVTFGSWPDVLYIFYYPLAALAFVLLYLDLGGRVQDAARAHRLHHGCDRIRIAAVVHRAGARRVAVGRRAAGELVGGRLRHRRCDRDDRRRDARHADHRLARRAPDRLAADRHGGDAGGRPLVDQRRVARNLRDRRRQRHRLLRVLPLHVRRRALSARATPAGQLRRSACRATCAARCPSSRSWSAPSRCSTTG